MHLNVQYWVLSKPSFLNILPGKFEIVLCNGVFMLEGLIGQC